MITLAGTRLYFQSDENQLVQQKREEGKKTASNFIPCNNKERNCGIKKLWDLNSLNEAQTGSHDGCSILMLSGGGGTKLSQFHPAVTN